MTQADFARRYGFPQPMVSQWMRGDRRPGRDNAARLEMIAGIPASYWRTVRSAARRGQKINSGRS